MGALTSSIGTWMQKVAQAWLIVMMTGSRSAFFLGLDSFLGELPLLLFTMVGGVFADRRDRRHMILMSQIIQMLVALVLAMLIYTRRIHIAHVLALSLSVGLRGRLAGPRISRSYPRSWGKNISPTRLHSIPFSSTSRGDWPLRRRCSPRGVRHGRVLRFERHFVLVCYRSGPGVARRARASDGHRKHVRLSSEAACDSSRARRICRL